VKDIKLGVGQIPLREMCCWLDQRCYSKDLAIDYIKNIYNIDVSDAIKEYEYYFEFNKNIFDYFNKKYPPKVEDDGTRKYFNKYGKRRYEQFYKCFVENDPQIYDELIDFSILSEHIHHIFPLEYGGNSNPKNLIGILSFFHDVLHKNPLQHIEKYCFQAVDYLKYIVYWDVKKMFDEYKLWDYIDKPKLLYKFRKIAIEEEMEIFYEKLIKEYNT